MQLFHFKVAPIRIDNDYKGHYIGKPPNLNYANISVFQIAKLRSREYQVVYSILMPVSGTILVQGWLLYFCCVLNVISLLSSFDSSSRLVQ